ncbi:cyclin-dependent protein kinase inhibitor SMR1-like [Juglans microcarpa x Juglans regia]|uniref:cyclin-dependent protein kinase inhibitor SMR1-like n=1 Tax=Juglans microcarpa x Juglans regia TaxID=2249226 RepID=UPI001B7E9EB0|nr:cyclin-dependent protein kinase inhibitor SMR1-like [Juglans microcarpa x Juglans regia]
MSTDLEFLHDLSKIPRLTVETKATAQASNDIADDIGTGVLVEPKKEDDNECCRTPTSKEHRIPEILDCPPAPRKPRRVPACKRKLSELKFFEIVNPEEVDAFFRSSFENVSAITSVKRRSRIQGVETLDQYLDSNNLHMREIEMYLR